MHPVRFSRTGAAGPLLIALALLGGGGCGNPSRAKVHGKVTLDGTPVGTGSIRFVPVDGKSPTAGGVIKDGEYTAEVPFGTMRVEISSSEAVGAQKPTAGPDSAATGNVYREVIPPQFNSRSKLVKEISAASSEVDFPLKSTE